MILEMGFMTNQSDDARMADEAVQLQMAEGIADGIDLYFSGEQ
jgi:N-acetylmuramoyl-L-alanine amidase